MDANDLSEVESCVCFRTRSVARALTQFYSQMLQPCGLLSTQFPLLAVLGGQSMGTPLSILAVQLGIDRTTLARNLKPLERMKLLSIEPDSNDRRVQRVRLTSAGRKKLEEAFPLWKKAQRHVVDSFGDARWGSVLVSLKELSATCQA